MYSYHFEKNEETAVESGFVWGFILAVCLHCPLSLASACYLQHVPVIVRFRTKDIQTWSQW